jgi:excisionase family DNA binding protein
MATMLRQPILPTEAEITQAQASLKLLKRDRSDRHFAIGSPSGLKVPLSESAFDLLLNILTEMSRGNAVLVMPINAELTTQEAADLLNVSRPHLIGLLESQNIPYRLVGRHRRILFKDLMQYRQVTKRRQFKALQELTAMDDVDEPCVDQDE